MMEQWRHNGESFFLIVESCGIAWKTEFIKQLSEVYPHAYIALIMDNAIWHSKTLDISDNIEFAFILP